MKIVKKMILIIIIVGLVVAISLQLIDLYVETDKQIAMRERVGKKAMSKDIQTLILKLLTMNRIALIV